MKIVNWYGCSNSAYQVEGGIHAAEKAQSMLDYYSHIPGTVKDGTTGDVGSDFYHCYEEDIKLMKKLGVNSYRLFLNWSRIIPDGKTEVSQVGINYYLNVINQLRMNGIDVIIEMTDLNIPLRLQIEAGILSPEFPSWFSYYASVCVSAFGSLVDKWIVGFQMEKFFGEGYQTGTRPPFLKVSNNLGIIAYRNFIRGIVLIDEIIKKKVVRPTIIYNSYVGLNKEIADSSSALRFLCKPKKEEVACSPCFYLDTVVFKNPNREVKELFKTVLTESDKLEIKKIAKPSVLWLDFESFADDDGSSIYYCCNYIYRRYKLPLVIGLTGYKYKGESTVEDPDRIRYIQGAYKSVMRLIEEGIPIRGFFYDSLLDGFEGVEGYTINRGLIKVDRSTLQRTEKKSFSAYQAIIKEN